MLTINNEVTLDAYAALLTLESTFGGRLVYVVANNSVVAQFKPLREHGGSETAEWAPAEGLVLTPQASFIDKISGARFRSAVAGSPGRVIAQLTEPGDILPASGTPFTQTLAASGGVTQAGAGSMQLISDQLLTVGAAAIEFANIPQTFAHLVLVFTGRGDGVWSNPGLRFNSDTGPNYDYARSYTSSGAPGGTDTYGGGLIALPPVPGAASVAGAFAGFYIWIPGYAGTTGQKVAVAVGAGKQTVAAGGLQWETDGGFWRSTNAINRVTLSSGSGNFIAGTRCTLYGLSVAA